jgi:hypothetical protein
MKANPFNITKAVDFSDQEINDYWVDMPRRGLLTLVKPCSAMPMIILGGKGSGKTHLLRYLSYPVQKIRNAGDGAGGVRAEEYVGIYVRCSGLNAARFSGKGQTEDVWAGLFAYYIELWLSQAMVTTAIDALRVRPPDDGEMGVLAREIDGLWDRGLGACNSLDTVLDHLVKRQKAVDVAVNNCGITKTLDVQIDISPGKLVFGIPRLIRNRCQEFSQALFVYLIDEYENLTEGQQQYLNTLLREKEAPTSFCTGSA